MIGSYLETTGAFLTILAPLVAVPLTMITFYLRSLREHQVSWHNELVRRVEAIENVLGNLRGSVSDFERDYTTKEEWLREGMWARRTLENLSGSVVRLETTVKRAGAKDELCRGVDGRVEQSNHESRGETDCATKDEA